MLLDLPQLCRALDAARVERVLTWTHVAREVGVSANTIRRYAWADDAEADGVLALIGWLGVAPETFIADSEIEGEALAPADNGVIRVDMAKVRALPGSPSAGRGKRTTIQRLTAVAQDAGVSIASLTRRSAV